MTEAPPADLGRRFERLRLATPQGMESLAASIRAEGILSPLATVELDGRIEVVDGFKRLRLATELRLETVLARVARGLVQGEGGVRDPRIEPALLALGAQIAVVETQVRAVRDDKAAA